MPFRDCHRLVFLEGWERGRLGLIWFLPQDFSFVFQNVFLVMVLKKHLLKHLSVSTFQRVRDDLGVSLFFISRFLSLKYLYTVVICSEDLRFALICNIGKEVLLSQIFWLIPKYQVFCSLFLFCYIFFRRQKTFWFSWNPISKKLCFFFLLSFLNIRSSFYLFWNNELIFFWKRWVL